MARARVDWGAVPAETWATRTDRELADALGVKPRTVHLRRKALVKPDEPRRGPRARRTRSAS